MQALVIGGSGFLGLEICKQLIALGINVKTFHRRPSEQLKALGVQQHLGSVEEETLIDKVVQNSDVVFYCAGNLDLRCTLEEHFNCNYKGVLHAVRAGLKHKIKAFILTSTPSVFLNPKGICGFSEYELTYSSINEPYVQSKIAAEKMLLTQHPYKFPFVILRPHQIWSDGNNKFSQELLKAHSYLRIIGDGKNRVDSIHVIDAANAHIKAMEKLLLSPKNISGRDYNLSSSRPFLLWKEINSFYIKRGLSPIVRKVSPFTVRLKSIIERNLKKESSSISEYVVIQLSVDRWFDCTRAQRELSFTFKRFQ